MVRRKDNKGRVLQKGESQRKDGRYVYQYTDLLGSRKSLYASTLSDLRIKKKEILHDIEDGVNANGAKMTLNQLFERYMSLKVNLRNSTRQYYTAIWKNNIKNTPLGRKEIGKIVKSDVLILYKGMSDRGLKYSTIKAFNGLLKSCFEFAMADDLIRKNPCIGCVKQFRKDDTKERIALTRQQERKLLEFAESSVVYARYVPMLKLMLILGLRCGEVIGLTWSDVNFEKREISINHQLVYRKDGDKYKLYAEMPKTKAGIRIIPMTNEVRRALLWQKKQQIVKEKKRIEIDGYKDFCFVTSSGMPILPGAVNSVLYNITNRCNKGIKDEKEKLPHISAHILRHTACTRMAEKGMDLKVLQYIMGHSNIAMTMQVYNHVTEERRNEEMKKMESVRLIG